VIGSAVLKDQGEAGMGGRQESRDLFGRERDQRISWDAVVRSEIRLPNDEESDVLRLESQAYMGVFTAT